MDFNFFKVINQKEVFYILVPVMDFLMIWFIYRFSMFAAKKNFFYREFQSSKIELTKGLEKWYYVKYSVIVGVLSFFIVYGGYENHQYGIANHYIKVFLITMPATWVGIHGAFKSIKSMSDEDFIKNIRETNDPSGGARY